MKTVLDGAPKGFGLGLALKLPETAPKALLEGCPKVPKGCEGAPKEELPKLRPAELAAGVLAPPPNPNPAAGSLLCLGCSRGEAADATAEPCPGGKPGSCLPASKQASRA